MNLAELSQLDGPSSELLYNFGLQPVSNRFLSGNCQNSAPTFSLELRINRDSGLIHLGKAFPVDELKPRYSWLTCFEPEDHLDAMVKTIINLPGVDKDSVFGAYSFKDDSTLQRLDYLGYTKQWRIDPEQDLGISDPCANVETYQAVFTPTVAQQICQNHGAADVIIVRHVVEHANNLSGFLESIRALIKPNGYIVWELPDCERALEVGDCTTVWEEHVFYFTTFTFKLLLESAGFSIVHYESVPYPLENSIVAIVQEGKGQNNPNFSDSRIVQEEIDRAYRFVDTIKFRRHAIRNKLENFRENVGRIALFGAGHLSVAFLSTLGLCDLIDFVVDDNPNKKGTRMPVGNLAIKGSEALYSEKVRLCLLGINPRNQSKVIAKHSLFEEQGGQFASIFPGSEVYLEHIS
ncbi:MAG: methyltransferase domain-containing protein [Cyanobacteria bacterium REEB444]|nr:methyltransferase domain-containing protein [Cyanobacteria bacterium REEB444]